MPIRQMLKIQPVGVPPEVGSSIVDILDPFAPIDLDIGYPRFDQTARQQATLPKLGVTVASADTRCFRCKVESAPPDG